MIAAWVDGRLVDPGGPALQVGDYGVTVGDGVFETVKVVGGRPFALRRHLDRLSASARAIGLSAELDRMRAGINAVLGAALPDPARLRVTVTGGPAPVGSGRGGGPHGGGPHGGGPPTVVVTAAALAAWPPTADVVTVPWPRNERGALVGVKTTSYAENVVALAYAAQRGGDEAIFANLAGNLCEGAGSNVVVGVRGRLVTPPCSSGCLAGVTRALLLEWLDVVEEDLPLSTLAAADEAFLASTTRDVQPVRSVDGRKLPAAPGPLTRQAADVFAERSAADTDP